MGSEAPRQRDAARTRGLLLEAAHRRFAFDGYAATTVREIADDAGVNVALISRYFSSKEGLFQACLESAVDDVTSSADGLRGLQQVADSISRQAVGQAPDGGPDQVLLLLLRSSGDERTEEMRVGVLRTFGQRLASLAGWTPDAADGDDLLLRAQLVLSVGIGIAVLRSARGLEPIASATAEQLSEPVHALVTAVLADQRR